MITTRFNLQSGRIGSRLSFARKTILALGSSFAIAAPTIMPDGPSLFTLVQEQLGLRLAGTKAPAEVLVIDHVG